MLLGFASKFFLLDNIKSIKRVNKKRIINQAKNNRSAGVATETLPHLSAAPEKESRWWRNSLMTHSD